MFFSASAVFSEPLVAFARSVSRARKFMIAVYVILMPSKNASSSSVKSRSERIFSLSFKSPSKPSSKILSQYGTLWS